MQSAFGFRTALPAARPMVFTRHHRLRAMCAADTGIIAVMERVIRYFVNMDIGPDVAPRPFGKRIDLHQLKFGVPLDQFRMGSGRRLIPPDSRNPGVEPFEDAGKRFDFPQLAAAVRIAGP